MGFSKGLFDIFPYVYFGSMARKSSKSELFMPSSQGISNSCHCKYPVKVIALATQVLNQLKEAITVQKIIEDEGFPLSFSFPGILRMRRNKR